MSIIKIASFGYGIFVVLSRTQSIYNVRSFRQIRVNNVLFVVQYLTKRCYYNSSHCPAVYHSINGQCYRRSAVEYSASTCQNIGGYYHQQAMAESDIGADGTATQRSASTGTCYFNSFNCSSFVVDGRHCYSNRSSTFSRATCANIGGIYVYLLDGTYYRSADVWRYPSSTTYYCLYNTFNCARLASSIDPRR